MAAAHRVLVVDDDPKFRSFAQQGLAESGYDTRTAGSVREAREVLRQHPIDLVLLDVTMPDEDGPELLREMQHAGTDVPVIFVTARGATSERVDGLALGADDYIVKPFSFAELLARIDAVLRRHHRVPRLQLGPLSIDLAHRKATCHGQDIPLSLKELDLLSALVQADGAVLSRSDLLREVWGTTHDPGTNVVDVHIGRVRRKVEREGWPRIETVRGQGYRISIDP